MSTAASDKFDPEKNIETWENQTESTVWLLVRDPRDASGYKKQRVGGNQGSKRIRLSTDDRRYNQEQVVDEMNDHDPFTNGRLLLVDEARAEDVVTTNHKTAGDLEEYLAIKDLDLFTESIEEIRSELTIRRLYGIAEKTGTAPQVEALAVLIEDRYGNAKTQESTREDSKGIRLTG